MVSIKFQPFWGNAIGGDSVGGILWIKALRTHFFNMLRKCTFWHFLVERLQLLTILPYSNVLLIWLTRFTEEEDPEFEILLSCLCEEHCFETFGPKVRSKTVKNSEEQWLASHISEPTYDRDLKFGRVVPYSNRTPFFWSQWSKWLNGPDMRSFIW